jgi:hypothetical protein
MVNRFHLQLYLATFSEWRLKAFSKAGLGCVGASSAARKA